MYGLYKTKYLINFECLLFIHNYDYNAIFYIIFNFESEIFCKIVA